MAFKANLERTSNAARGLAVLILVASGIMLPCAFSPARQTAKQPSDATLRISGKVDNQLVLREAELQRMPRTRVTVRDEKGARITYEGVAVAELLQRAGVPLGNRLRGTQMTLYVIVDASDGYKVVFALPEFDPGFASQIILLADKRDGLSLSAPEGPFRIVVPGDKRHARWVREVIDLDVEQAR